MKIGNLVEFSIVNILVGTLRPPEETSPFTAIIYINLLPKISEESF